MTDENTTPVEGRPTGGATPAADAVTRRNTFRRPDETDSAAPAAPVPASSHTGEQPSAADQGATGGAPVAPPAAFAPTAAPAAAEHPIVDRPAEPRSRTEQEIAELAAASRHDATDDDIDDSEPTPPPLSAGSHAGVSAPGGGTPAPAAAPVVTPPPPIKEAEKQAPAGTVPVAVAGAAGEVPRTIYVEAPTAPKKKGNRGVGILISLLATVVFAIVWAGVSAAVIAIIAPQVDFVENYTGFVQNPAAWLPIITFFAGLVVVVSILNRAGWAWYIVGGLLVGLFAYAGYLGGALIWVAGDISGSEVQGFLTRTALNPLAIAVGLTAREVSIWTGAAIAARGRRVKARNIEAREQFDRESAERRAEYERVRAGFTTN